MSRKPIVTVSLLTAGLAAVAVLISLAIRRTQPPVTATRLSDQAVLNSAEEAFAKMDATDREKLKNGLGTLVGELGKFGLKPVPKLDGKLATAVATGDYGTIRRAFSDAVYGRFSNMNESVAVMKTYLDSRDVIASFLAAEHLLIAGDRSGVQKLIEILERSESIPYRRGDPSDLRNKACEILGKFRIEEAIPFLKAYHARTEAGHAVGALTAIGQRAGSWQEKFSGLESAGYAMVGASEYLPDIKRTFHESTNPEIRVDAAWAAAYMGGGPEYINFLIDASKLAAEAPDDRGAGEFNKSREALRYLGTIQTPEAVTALEKALGSKNPRASSVALVNLLFNQKKPSEKARAMLLEQLSGAADHRIYPELAMRMIAALDDTELKEAAARASRQSSAYGWRFWGVERANWPVENWIYDYVVILNRNRFK